MRHGFMGFGRRRPWRDRRGVTAVETGLLMAPFITLLIAVLQTGIYFTTQSALDTGVLNAAEALRVSLAAGASFSPPSNATLKSQISGGGGSMISTANLAVDVQQMTALAAGAVPISDGSLNWGGSDSVLVVRAQSAVSWIAAGSGWLTVTSMAIVRRPAY
jgi:Flp pilus assembly protein TadG